MSCRSNRGQKALHAVILVCSTCAKLRRQGATAWAVSGAQVRRFSTVLHTTGPRALGAAEAVTPLSDMRVAVVGGGLAGLATAWHLQQRGVQRITIFDPRPPGQAEASSKAGGLLHPLTPRNKLIWRGVEGYHATMELLEAAESALASESASDAAALRSPPGSILRPALTAKHQTEYQAAAAALPEWTSWLDAEAFPEASCGGGAGMGGLLLRNSVVVHTPLYLRGLWMHICSNSKAVAWQQSRIGALGDLREFEAVVVASGAGISAFPELLSRVAVEFVKGRTLVLDAKGLNLDKALLCGEYVVPGVEGDRPVMRCGATREYVKPQDLTEAPDTWAGGDVASDGGLMELRGKAERIHPRLKGANTLSVTEGTRVAAKRSNLGKLPIVGRVSSSMWLYTALGGRGLIHHAIIARYLAEAIVSGDEACIPPELRAGLGALTL